MKYELNGGTMPEAGCPDSYTVESEDASLSEPTKAGYTFAGWYTTSTFAAGTEITKLPGGHAENLTLYAKWKEDVYTIRYDLGEASGATNPNKSLTKVAKGDIVTLKPASATGWIFEGWALSADTEALTRKEDGTTEHMPVDNVTYYAKWTHPRYTITYTPGEGIDSVPVTGYYNNRITEPTFTAPSGLKLLGWLDEDKNVWNSYRFPAKDVTLTAVWGLGDIESDADFLAVADRSGTYEYKATKIRQSIELKADVSVPAGRQLDLNYLNGTFASTDGYAVYTITITGSKGYRPLFGSYISGSYEGCTISRINVAFAEDEITVDHTSKTEEMNWGILIGKMGYDVMLNGCKVLGGSNGESVTVNYNTVWRTDGEPTENIGALVGYNLAGRIVDCSAGSAAGDYVTLNIGSLGCALYHLGGLVGRNDGRVSCMLGSRTRIVLNGPNGQTGAGGLVGLMDSTSAELEIRGGLKVYSYYQKKDTAGLDAFRGLLVGRLNQGKVSYVGNTTVYAESADLPLCGEQNGGTIDYNKTTGENVTGSLWEIQ